VTNWFLSVTDVMASFSAGSLIFCETVVQVHLHMSVTYRK